MLSLVWLDDYHLGDPLFVRSVARSLSLAPASDRTVLLLHGAAERAARMLEARSAAVHNPKALYGLTDPPVRAVVEQAIREQNKDIVATLTEFGVPAVGIQGSDRRMLFADDAGDVNVGDARWLETLISQHTVPVISSMAAGPSEPIPVRPVLALAALAEKMADFDPILTVFTKGGRSGLLRGGDRLTSVDPREIGRDEVGPEPVEIQRFAAESLRIHLTSPSAAFTADPASRTLVAHR